MSGLKRTLKLLLEKGCEVGVELEETLVEDLPEEVDWDLHARASGKLCSLCGAEGAENGHRVFKCPRCGIVWDRDKAAVANLVLRYLRTLYKEEFQDADPLCLVDAVQAWLKRHTGFLLRT